MFDDANEPLTREAQYHRDLKRAMRQQDKQRRLDPDRNYSLSQAKFLFRWSVKGERWVPVAFVICGKLTAGRLRRLRRRHKVSPNALIRVIDLWELRRRGLGGPPARFVSRRPDVPYAMPLTNAQTRQPFLLNVR